MKRIILVTGTGLLAAVTQSKWVALVFLAALLATFVYGVFETSR